jgi:hypothetical protein
LLSRKKAKRSRTENAWSVPVPHLPPPTKKPRTIRVKLSSTRQILPGERIPDRYLAHLPTYELHALLVIIAADAVQHLQHPQLLAPLVEEVVPEVVNLEFNAEIREVLVCGVEVRLERRAITEDGEVD